MSNRSYSLIFYNKEEKGGKREEKEKKRRGKQEEKEKEPSCFQHCKHCQLQLKKLTFRKKDV